MPVVKHHRWKLLAANRSANGASPAAFTPPMPWAITRTGWRTGSIGQVHPRVDLLAVARGYPEICPSAEIAGHALTPPCVTISPPACLAKSAPNNAPGVNVLALSTCRLTARQPRRRLLL